MTLLLDAQALEVDRGSSLVSLPLDMQTYLLSFVAPLDILHLRMTCRSFFGVTSQQIVWIEALRQMCLTNAVFLPTFPLDEMTLPELEHATMAPYKWLSLASSAEGSLNTHRMRFLSPVESSLSSDELDATEEDDFEVRSLFLVPGGRFLVTFSWRWVCVWDLGYKTPELPSPRDHDGAFIPAPIAKVKVELHSMHLVHPSPDGEALRIVVSCPSYSQTEQKLADVLQIYEIYPQDEDAELEMIARLEVVGEDEISFYSLSGDCYIFLHGSIVKIWNFKTNGWTSWTVRGDFHQAIVTPTHIFLIHVAGVSIWLIPRLMTNAPLFSFVNPTPQPPILDILYTIPRPVGVDPDLYAGPSDWYSGTPLPITYDIETPLSVDEIHLQRYEVVLKNEQTPYATLLEHSAAIIPALYNGDFHLSPYRFCLNSLVTWWFERRMDTMKIYTGPLRLPQGAVRAYEPQTRTHDVLTADISGAETASSFCPVSGRFVYLDDEDESLQGVVVLDFLLPMGILRSTNSNTRPSHHSESDNNATDGRWMGDLTRWNANLYNPTQF